MSNPGTVPLLGPDGQVRSVPQDQVSAAIQAGGKQVTPMLDPQGTRRWVPNDQVEAAQAAGGTPIRQDGSFTVTPTEGESFSDTMRRAVAAGRTVTPQLIQQQTMTGIKDAPLALGAAATAGVAGPAMLAGAGELGAAVGNLTAPTTQLVRTGAGYMTNWAEAEGPSLARQALSSPVAQQAIRMLGSRGAAFLGGAALGGYKYLKSIGIIH